MYMYVYIVCIHTTVYSALSNIVFHDTFGNNILITYTNHKNIYIFIYEY